MLSIVVTLHARMHMIVDDKDAGFLAWMQHIKSHSAMSIKLGVPVSVDVTLKRTLVCAI